MNIAFAVDTRHFFIKSDFDDSETWTAGQCDSAGFKPGSFATRPTLLTQRFGLQDVAYIKP